MLIKFIFLLILGILINISCINDCENLEIFNSNDNSILEVEKIIYETINDEKIFVFKKNESYNNNLLVNFFSINCDIQIHINNTYDFEKINNIRNNDSFSIRIKSDEIENTKIKVLHLNYDNNPFRTCPLVINTIYEENSTLKYEGKEPTILFFDDYLKEIELSYNYAKDSFVTFSFIFNEIASFYIIYSYNGKNEKTKSISNSNNIFLYDLPVIDKKIINIKIIRIDIYEHPVLLTFRVFTNNPTPYILQKNYLNQGFITSNLQNQYYYMEIFKDEEGEIMLHDKRQNGKIIGKICKQNEANCTIDDINSFPNNDDTYYLKYIGTIKKLKFEYEKTEICEEGCFLLITYYHEIDSKDNDKLIIGYEFTLLERVWNYEDWSNLQIINIPNNEFIFGYFEENLINHHYYSIFVSDETDKIIIQIKSNYIQGFYGEGKKRLNTYGIFNTKTLDIEKEIIELDVQKFKNKYMSFAFRSKDFFEKELSFYYFRVFQYKKNDYSLLIIPLDSNVVNVFNPFILTDYDCYFLLKNDYNEFSLNYSIFSNQNEESEIYYFSIQKETDIDITLDNLYNLIDVNFDDFTLLKRPLKYLSKNNSNHISFIFFYFDFYYSYNTKDILSNFYKNESIIYPNIYSSEIYLLGYIANFNLSMQSNFSLSVKWINGEGQINNLNKVNFELNKNFKGKPYSFSIEDITNLTCINKNEFVIYLELNYITENNVIEKIKVDQPKSEIIKNKHFPIYYYFEYSLENPYLDINLKLLDFENYLTNFTIEGMLCKQSTIDDLRNGKHINFINDYRGQYDLCTKNGLLQIYSNINDDGMTFDLYILIKINSLESKQYSNVLVEILCLEKFSVDNNNAAIPINQFITGSFNEIGNTTNIDNLFYSIMSNEDEDKANDTIIIEFGKNYDGIDLNINGLKFKRENTNGFDKYIINDYNQTILLNIKLNKNNDSKDVASLNANYILRYYYDNIKYNDNEFVFNETNHNIAINENIVKIFYEYSFKNNKNNPNNTNNTNNVNYKIYSSIFLDENLTEILNTSAITSSKPLSQSFALVNNNDNNTFNINFIFNMPDTNNYKYIIQIKVDIDDDDYYQKMGILSYTIPIDLSDNRKKEDKTPENNNILAILIIVGISIAIIIIISILFIIFYLKIKKKNKALQEKVLAVSFSNDQSDAIINNNQHSKKDEEYENRFI